MKKIVLLSLIILAGCSNPPAPNETTQKKESPAKPKTATVRTAANPWTTGSYAPKEGETEGRKYVRFVTEGVFSDATKSNNYLYAEVIFNKANAGILLHELKKSNPAKLFTDPVQITMINSSGQELQMTSSRKWNSSGGILIERNNNDYSQFRIFLLQSKGAISVKVNDSANSIYQFTLIADGFSDSFSGI